MPTQPWLSSRPASAVGFSAIVSRGQTISGLTPPVLAPTSSRASFFASRSALTAAADFMKDAPRPARARKRAGRGRARAARARRAAGPVSCSARALSHDPVTIVSAALADALPAASPTPPARAQHAAHRRSPLAARRGHQGTAARGHGGTGCTAPLPPTTRPAPPAAPRVADREWRPPPPSPSTPPPTHTPSRARATRAARARGRAPAALDKIT